MTSNERKIIKYLWDTKGRAHIGVVSQNVGFTSDYTRLICRSLARGGYIQFAGSSECYLLKKGRSRFEAKEIPTTSAKENIREPKKKTGSGNAPVASISSFDKLPDASEKDKEKLVQAGYKSTEDLSQAPITKLIQGLGVSLSKAANWINQARRQTGVINEGGRKDKK